MTAEAFMEEDTFGLDSEGSEGAPQIIPDGRKRLRYENTQVTLVVKSPPANAGDLRDTGLIPASGRSPGGGHGNPLLYSCLENPMDRGAELQRATVRRIAESDKTEATYHASTHALRESSGGAKVERMRDMEVNETRKQ